jgi:hypothetical protein
MQGYDATLYLKIEEKIQHEKTGAADKGTLTLMPLEITPNFE